MSLDRAVAAFLEGYRIARVATRSGAPDSVVARLQRLAPDRVPFAFEGAAMALQLADDGDESGGRIPALRAAVAPAWHPFVSLGVGCALARLGRALPSDPIVVDGYGFQVGLDRGVSGRGPAWGSPSYAHGWGRALWFTTRGDARACARTLVALGGSGPAWRGLATACVFAGDPRGHAGLLADLAKTKAGELQRGARHALAVWSTLGGAPARAGRAAESLGSGEASRVE